MWRDNKGFIQIWRFVRENGNKKRMKRGYIDKEERRKFKKRLTIEFNSFHSILNNKTKNEFQNLYARKWSQEYKILQGKVLKGADPV